MLVVLAAFAGCNGGGGDGTATTGVDTTGAETTAAGTGTSTSGTTAAGTQTGTSQNGDMEMLFGGQAVSVENGTITSDGTFLGNATILNNTQGDAGFSDVTIYTNGTVLSGGEVVGKIQIYELCPVLAEDSRYYFDGDTVNVSAGAQGNVYLDGPQDSFVNINVTANNQSGLTPGLTNVRLATNGTILNQTGANVGQFKVNPLCPSASTEN